MSKRLQVADQSEPKVLVVDDEQDIRQVVTLSLQQSGFRTNSAENAENACRLLEQEQFDAVITDVMMPDEDGIKFLMKVHQAYPEIPVILMTGYAQLQMTLDAIKHGAFDLIQKPFDFESLIKTVDRAVTYGKLQRSEKSQRVELEEVLAARTAELKNVKAELDFAHSKILKVVTEYSAAKDKAPPVNNSSDTDCKLFSRIV